MCIPLLPFRGTCPTYSVRTWQETHYVSATQPNQLILFRETVAVSCENLTEHTCAQGAELKQVVHIVTTGLQRVNTIFALLNAELIDKQFREARPY
jgi:hypothetical protein